MRGTQDRRISDLVVRVHEHTVCVGNREIPLTEREYEIVALLAEHPGWVCTPGQLAEISGEGAHSSESITVLVSRLRHKLEEAGAGDMVQTVRGSGYRIRPGHWETDTAEEGPPAVRDAAWSLQEEIVKLEFEGTAEQLVAAARILSDARVEIAALRDVGKS
jgi:DNA-binding winged helix-turn-helix (wHTH) protein